MIEELSHRQGSNRIVTPSLTRTISNIRRTILSDSPRYLEPRVEVEMLKKVVPHSVATALASMVFPVPGGPTIRTPWGEGGEAEIRWVAGEGRECLGGWEGEGVVGWEKRGEGKGGGERGDKGEMLKYLLNNTIHCR